MYVEFVTILSLTLYIIQEYNLFISPLKAIYQLHSVIYNKLGEGGHNLKFGMYEFIFRIAGKVVL